jgi:hypothetical protein
MNLKTGRDRNKKIYMTDWETSSHFAFSKTKGNHPLEIARNPTFFISVFPCGLCDIRDNLFWRI